VVEAEIREMKRDFTLRYSERSLPKH